MIGRITDGGTIGQPVPLWEKPALDQEFALTGPASSDDFQSESLGLQWQWQANWQKSWYELGKDQGLTLFARPASRLPACLAYAPNLLCQLWPAAKFSVTTQLTFKPALIGDQAGLAITGSNYAALCLEKDQAGVSLKFIEGQLESKDQTYTASETSQWLTGWPEPVIYLRVRAQEGASCSFSYSTDALNYQQLQFDFTARPGPWVGARLAIFCQNKAAQRAAGQADFAWFRVEKI